MTGGEIDSSTGAGDSFRQWARRIRKSDTAAFRQLFEATNAELLRFAWRYTFDEEVARDVVQDVFLKVWQVRETLDEKKSLRALLFTMVRNRSLNHRRSKRDEERSVDANPLWEPEGDTNVEAEMEGRMLGDRIRGYVEQLPDRRREAFILSRYHGMTHDEIASLMGLTARTVNTHIVLALKDLRARLEAQELREKP